MNAVLPEYRPQESERTIERGGWQMNFCAGMAPEWADEIRHPTMDTVEYWQIGSFLTAKGTDKVFPVGLMQNGPEGKPLIVLGDLRFTPFQANDCIIGLKAALELAGGWDGNAETDGSVPAPDSATAPVSPRAGRVRQAS
jgi:hypothetical protein